MWYSHRVTRRRKWCVQAKSRSTSSADDSGVACVRPEFDFGAVGSARSVRCRIRQRVFGRARRSRRPCRRLGGGQFVEETAGKNLFHKLALGRRSALYRYGERKTVSSGDSDDLCALAATGRPDCEAPFWRSRKWHPRMPRLGSTDRARGGPAPGAAAPVPASHSVPIAGTGGDRSGKADIFRAVHATAPRCPTPRAHHAGRRVCRAMDDHAYRRGVAAAAPAPPLPTVHRSDPNGHASAQSEISRASPECLQSGFDLFMRLVLRSGAEKRQ